MEKYINGICVQTIPKKVTLTCKVILVIKIIHYKIELFKPGVILKLLQNEYCIKINDGKYLVSVSAKLNGVAKKNA